MQGRRHFQHDDEPDAIERSVHELGLRLSFVHFRAHTEPRLAKPGIARHIGFDDVIPFDQFHGLVVVDSTHQRR